MHSKKMIFWLVLLLPFLNSCKKDENKLVSKDEPYDKSITAIAIQGNNVWVGTSFNGIYKYDGESWIVYTESDGLVSDTITALVVNNDGILWIGTNLGISKFENQHFTNFIEPVDLFLNSIYSLACDAQNNLWIGTARNRLRKYDGANFTNFHVNPIAGGISGHIHTVAPDLNGNIWVGSCKTGLSKFDGTNWTDKINNLGVFVNALICDKDGGIWVGDYFGTHFLSNNVWTNYSVADGLADNSVLCFCLGQQNNIWIGTNDGLSKYNGTSWTKYTTENGLLNNSVTALACDQSGNVWVGGFFGLKRLEQ